MLVEVTGFEPFYGVDSNPTLRILPRLAHRLGPAEIRTHVLPVDTEGVRPLLRDLWAEGPRVLIHLGVASESDRIRVETRAENRLCFRVPDNSGRTVRGAPVVDGAPSLIGSRLPVDIIEARLRDAEIRCQLSATAGNFLCNQVMYESLYALPRTVPVGFLHVPPDEELADRLGCDCSVSLEDQVRAVYIAIETTLEWLASPFSTCPRLSA